MSNLHNLTTNQELSQEEIDFQEDVRAEYAEQQRREDAEAKEELESNYSWY